MTSFIEARRCQGLDSWLVECIIAHPELQILRLFLLVTCDDHELHRRYGGLKNRMARERLTVRRGC